MIVIIDYSVGNLFSVKNALSKIGIENKISSDKDEIMKADALILPGVGAFRDAMNSLENSGLIPTIKEFIKTGKPLLGICLGMQLLYEKSYEYGEYQGLGFIKGEICPMKSDLVQDLKVPHMGWNNLKFNKNNEVLKYINEDDYVYFVHSFYAKSNWDEVVAYVDYDVKIPAIVNNGNVYGMQFHPEKSGDVGLNLLKAYGELIKK